MKTKQNKTKQNKATYHPFCCSSTTLKQQQMHQPVLVLNMSAKQRDDYENILPRNAISAKKIPSPAET
jgi:hypothetical protein